MWAYLKNKTRTITIGMAKYWHKKMYQPLPFYHDLGWYTKLFTDPLEYQTPFDLFMHELSLS